MEAPDAKTLVETLRIRAKERPDAVAFRFLLDGLESVESITYGELDRRAAEFAIRITSHAAPGDRALLLHPPGISYIVALFGCFYAGLVAVPAYPPRPGRLWTRLVALATDAGARVALTTREMLDLAGPFLAMTNELEGMRWLASDALPEACVNGAGRVSSPTAETLALLQYTSGSTSAPKGVRVTHGNFTHNMRALAAAARITEDDRIVLWLPPYHDLGLVCGILVPVFLGIEATLMSPPTFLRTPRLWLDAMSRYGGTISGGPNFAFELCARRVSKEQREGLDLRKWRLAFNGSERVKAETLDRFSSTFEDIGFDARAFTTCFGLAEATLGVSLGEVDLAPRIGSFDPKALMAGQAVPLPGERGRTLVSCGVPVDSVVIVDPDSRTRLADGTIGEIWVCGPSVTGGYFGKPELSDATVRARLCNDDGDEKSPRYLRTGDLGFLDAGELFWAGRIKDLIIVAGANYYPEDMEHAALGCHERVQGTGAAFAIEGEGGHERVVLVQALDSEDGAGTVEIAEAIRAAVADAVELSVYDVVLVGPRGVPRTSSGKVMRSACRAAYEHGELEIIARSTMAPGEDDGAAGSEFTAHIQATIAELLGIDSIGTHDDLFLYGGHSLLATQLVSRLRETLRVDVTLRTVFESPTAAALAARLQTLPKIDEPERVARISRDGPLPLSFSQERMWFLHQLEPNGAAYNVAGAVAIEGPLSVPALQRALDEILARHEVLRSNYPSVDGVPQTVIATERTLCVEPVDLSREVEPAAEAMTRASRLAHTPFDVAGDPLARVELYVTGPDRHVLAVSLHHLVTDGWSMGVLLSDLLEFYEAYRAGRPIAPRSDDITYVDYAHHQRVLLGTGRLDGERDYWRDKLHGAEPLELPTDRPRRLGRSSAGALEPLVLPEPLFEALRALGKRHGATLSMVMFAAFEVLLHRYTRQSDIVVGVPIANRNHLSAEPFIGTLVNTLALRVEVDPALSFSELLGRVREASLDAFAHQDFPFERLVAELPVERQAGQSPVVQVMFDYQNAPMPKASTETLRMRPVILSRGAAQFDLSLLILDTDFGKTAGVEYRTDLFDRATIVRFLSHYTQILEGVLADPSVSIGRIPLLDAHERNDVLRASRSSDESLATHVSVHRLFAEQCERTPQAEAVVDFRGAMSYAELDRASSALARTLRRRGVGPGKRVAVLLERSSNIVVSLLGILKAGAAYVPLDPLYPEARLSLVLDDSTPHLVVTQSNLVAKLPVDFTAPTLLFDEKMTDRASDIPASLEEAPEDPALPAYVLYTSGSTGRPKGVEVSVGALSNFLRSMRHTPGMQPGDRLLSVTTIAFDISGLELLLPLVSGATVHVAQAHVVSDGLELLALFNRVLPTHMQATPATWRMLLEAGFRGHERLTVLCGGEDFPSDLARALVSRSRAVWNLYGPTETTIWSTIHRVAADENPVSIGRPIDRTSVYVLDAERELVPFGIPGELYIGGAGVANGYLGQPELTAERFVRDPFSSDPAARMYRTGDLGYLRSDGLLHSVGRLDTQIKIRGYRIEPGEVELALKAAVGARDAVVTTFERKPGERQLVAYYVADSAFDSSVVRERLQRRLPAYMVPALFVRLERLPQTPNGKIDRKALPAPDPASSSTERHVAPRDALERHLANLWSEVLETNNPSITDDFFHLGGHSLLAVRLFAKMERELSISLPLSALLESPTIAELADRVRQTASAERDAERRPPSERPERLSHVMLLQRGGSASPFFCVHGAGGNVLNMVNFARHLGAERSFYGFVARGTDGRLAPLRTIEGMAAAYIAEMLVVQPTGPYYLGGYCGGGVIAFEMARQLVAAGRRVRFLVLIDSYHPKVDTRRSRLAQFVRGVVRDGPAYVARRALVKFKRDATEISDELRIRYHVANGGAVPLELRDHHLTRAFFRAVRQYEPAKYPGKLTVLRAEEVHPLLASIGPDLGWGDLAQGGIDAFDIPGGHETLAHEPHVSRLANILRTCLRRAERPSLAPPRPAETDSTARVL